MKKYLKFLVTVLYFVPSLSFAAPQQECKTHKLFCKILKFNPKIDRSFAMDLSNKISAKAKIAGVDPNVSLAILLQESGLRHVNTYKTHSTLEEFCESGKCFKIVKEVNEVFDMSVAQINVNTANEFGFDIERLYKGDLDYALDCHFIILKQKMEMCKNKEDSWSCYHSINDPYRQIYVKLVKRFL